MDFLLHLTPSGTIASVSQGAEIVLGQAASQLVGRELQSVFPEFEVGADSAKSPLMWHAAGMVTSASGLACAVRRCLLPDGSALLDLRAQPDVCGLCAERFLTNVLADSEDAILCLDPQERVMIFNRAAERLYGWQAEEILGQPVEVLVPEDQRHELDGLAAAVRRDGQVMNFNTVRRRRDGSEVNVVVSRTALHDLEGNFVGTSVIVRDVTADVQARRQIQHSEKMAAIGQLAAGIAHELGTPLNVISGTAEFLASEISSKEELAEGLQTIRRQAEACRRLLRDLMDYARRPAFEMAVVNLNGCIEDTLRLVHRLLERHHITVEAELDDATPLIRGDSNQIEQVLMNIFINAWQAMARGGKLTVRTRCEARTGDAQIEINDTGPGIAPDHLPNIFNPFFTTKEAGGGTGLGLAVCDQIVSAHGGRIRAKSEPGRGATFIVSLPGHRPEAPTDTRRRGEA